MVYVPKMYIRRYLSFTNNLPTKYLSGTYRVVKGYSTVVSCGPTHGR